MLLNVHAVPNASQSEMMGWHNGALKIRLSAPPIEGKANEELRRFLAKIFGIAPSLIEIERGAGSKYKRLRLPITREDIEAALRQHRLDSRDGSASFAS